MANVVNPFGGFFARKVLFDVFGDDDSISGLERVSFAGINGLFLQVLVAFRVITYYYIVCYAVSGHKQRCDYK
jgi:hypothetical protein